MFLVTSVIIISLCRLDVENLDKARENSLKGKHFDNNFEGCKERFKRTESQKCETSSYASSSDEELVNALAQNEVGFQKQFR